MADVPISEELWQEFHGLVNMTPQQLEEWMRVQASHDGRDEAEVRAGLEVGRRVVGILGKGRDELDEEDVTVMESIVGRIRLERRENRHPAAGEEAWRRRLMWMGHDPGDARP